MYVLPLQDPAAHDPQPSSAYVQYVPAFSAETADRYLLIRLATNAQKQTA
jgi:hypothetical protein